MNEETKQPGGGFSSQLKDKVICPAREDSCIKQTTEATKETVKPALKEAEKHD